MIKNKPKIFFSDKISGGSGGIKGGKNAKRGGNSSEYQKALEELEQNIPTNFKTGYNQEADKIQKQDEENALKQLGQGIPQNLKPEYEQKLDAQQKVNEQEAFEQLGGNKRVGQNDDELNQNYKEQLANLEPDAPMEPSAVGKSSPLRFAEAKNGQRQILPGDSKGSDKPVNPLQMNKKDEEVLQQGTVDRINKGKGRLNLANRAREMFGKGGDKKDKAISEYQGEKALQDAETAKDFARQLAIKKAKDLLLKRAVAMLAPLLPWLMIAALLVGLLVATSAAVICLLDRNPVTQIFLPESLKGFCGGTTGGGACAAGYVAWTKDANGNWVQGAGGSTVASGGGGTTTFGSFGQESGQLSPDQCANLKKLLPFFQEGAAMYTTSEFPITVDILAGIAWLETKVGTYSEKAIDPANPCVIYGDRGRGHGIFQIDGASGDFTGNTNDRPSFLAPGTPTKVKDKNGKTLIWSDCRDNVVYGAQHLRNQYDLYNQKIKTRILAAGIKEGTPEFTYELTRQVINSNNRGGLVIPIGTDKGTGCQQVRGRCVYGAGALDLAADARKCLETSTSVATSNNTANSTFANLTKNLNNFTKIFTGVEAEANTLTAGVPAERQRLAQLFRDGKILSQDSRDVANITGGGFKDNLILLMLKLYDSGISFVTGIENGPQRGYGDHGGGRAMDFFAFVYHQNGTIKPKYSADYSNPNPDPKTLRVKDADKGNEEAIKITVEAVKIMDSGGVLGQSIGPDNIKKMGIVQSGNREIPGHDNHIHYAVKEGNNFNTTGVISNNDSVTNSGPVICCPAGVSPNSVSTQAGQASSNSSTTAFNLSPVQTDSEENAFLDFLANGFSLQVSAETPMNKPTGTDPATQFMVRVATMEGAFATGSGGPNIPQKNNNPGNLKGPSSLIETYLKQKFPGSYAGGIPTDSKKHLVFESQEHGWAALYYFFQRNFAGNVAPYDKAKTIGEFFNIYAPGSDGNNLSEYMDFVEKGNIALPSGGKITRDTPISEMAKLFGSDYQGGLGATGNSGACCLPSGDPLVASSGDNSTTDANLPGPSSTAKDGEKPTKYTDLTENHRKLLDWVATQKNYTKNPIASGPDPNLIKSTDQLIAKAKSDGIELEYGGDKSKYGWRSLDTQVQLFFDKISNVYGGQTPVPEGVPDSVKNDYLNRASLSAPPGPYSEHIAGKAIDFYSSKTYPGTQNLDPKSYSLELYNWLKKNAPVYGFALSYGENSTHGAGFEPWHWKYVGTKTSFVETPQTNTNSLDNFAKIFTGVEAEAVESENNGFDIQQIWNGIVNGVPVEAAGDKYQQILGSNYSLDQYYDENNKALAARSGSLDKRFPGNPNYFILHITTDARVYDGGNDTKVLGQQFHEGITRVGPSKNSGFTPFGMTSSGKVGAFYDPVKYWGEGTDGSASRGNARIREITSDGKAGKVLYSGSGPTSVDAVAVQVEMIADSGEAATEAQAISSGKLIAASGVMPDKVLTHYAVQPSDRQTDNPFIAKNGTVDSRLVKLVSTVRQSNSAWKSGQYANMTDEQVAAMITKINLLMAQANGDTSITDAIIAKLGADKIVVSQGNSAGSTNPVSGAGCTGFVSDSITGDGVSTNGTVGTGSATLLALAKASSEGKRPDGRCQYHVESYLDKVSLGGLSTKGLNFPNPVGFQPYLVANKDKLGIKNLLDESPNLNPYNAPPGSVVIVTPGGIGTCAAVHGDIAVADGSGKFYNGGVNSFGGEKCWNGTTSICKNSPRCGSYGQTGKLLGIWVPK